MKRLVLVTRDGDMKGRAGGDTYNGDRNSDKAGENGEELELHDYDGKSGWKERLGEGCGRLKAKWTDVGWRRYKGLSACL